MRRRWGTCLAASAVLAAAAPARADERSQDFSSDPGWDGLGNRSSLACTARYQNFGYSADTSYASGGRGEVGGTFKRSLRLASYAKDIASRDLRTPLRASGMLSLPSGAAGFPQADGGDVVIGWFNSRDSHFWRLSNSIVLRLDGLYGGRVRAYVAYASDHWLSHSLGYFETDGKALALGRRYPWRLSYDPPPKGVNRWGRVTLKIGTWDPLVISLTQEAYKDGATFDRFGMLNQTKGVSASGERRYVNVLSAFIDNLSLDGRAQGFSPGADPGWVADGSRVDSGEDDCASVRGRQDFGYSGETPAGQGGGIGGRPWRTEVDDPDGVAYYADRVADLDLSRPLHLHGHLSQVEAYADSGLFLGWFNHQDSRDDADHHQPTEFLGVAFGGLSDSGYWVGPAWRSDGSAEGRLDQHSSPPDGPIPIHPNGARHEFDLSYEPGDCGSGAKGRIRMSLDGTDAGPLAVDACARANFDRFGLRTARPGGQSQLVYFDDLTYSVSASSTQRRKARKPTTKSGRTPP